ncbi:MAG: secretion protein F [Clostridia bacterium]|nr:secretion protein F [Clostridia bacterium]
MQVIIALVIALGVFMITADTFHIPYLRTSMAMDRLARRQKEKTSQVDIWLKGLAVWIAGKLRLNEYRKAQLASDLRSAGIPLTPEMHIANSLVQSLLVGAGAIPFLFFMPFISAVLVGSAVFLYFYNARGVAEKIREKRRQIEFELPRFVAHIDKTLKHNRDVLAIIDSYKENAGDAMKSELEITAADMRSGNYEAALTRLESRVGSSMLSDTTRGLIGVLRGDDTDAYWSNLALKFSDYQRQLLKAEALKVPGKVRRLSMVLLYCFLAMYMVVIILQIADSMQGILSL